MAINTRTILSDTNLEFRAKRAALASIAENALPYPSVSPESLSYLENGSICDLNEGHAPYRPRYLLPDYRVILTQGSEFLGLAPAQNLYDAVNALLIAYSWVPSITGYPVYVGDLDELLEPYMDSASDSERYNLIKMLLVQIDRIMPDAFVHADIGPRDTRAGRTILNLEKEMKKAVPNISFRFSSSTPQEFSVLAAETALVTGKPYFVNHDVLIKEVSPDYAVASCYNTLIRGGGSHTLVRLSLKKIAEKAKTKEAFLGTELPKAVSALTEIINARAKYLVEESRFFDSSFLAREKIISLDKFTSMAGVFGLYECVELLSGNAALGKSDEADALGKKIIEETKRLVKSVDGAYCGGFSGKIGFHAQSGIDTDSAVTPGVRVRSGCEAPLARQIALEGSLHREFDAGASEICVFDQSAKQNPAGIVTIARGAMKAGIKIFAISSADSELVRITGYLVKRADANKWIKGERLFREDTVALAAETIRRGGILERAERKAE